MGAVEMNMDFTKFLLWEATSRDTIDFKKIYVDMADDLIAGLLLSQIVYWHLPNEKGESKLRVHKHGFDWIAKGREEWYEEIRISARQFDRAIKILEGKGLIAKTHYRFNGLRTVHVRLIQDAFMDAWSNQTVRPVLHKQADRSYTNRQTEVDESVRPLTETTAETTAETGAALAATVEQPTNGHKKDDDFLPDAPTQMGLLFAGRTNGNTPAHEDAEKALQRSGWNIRKRELKDAAIHFLAATGWEVPRADDVRSDWIKTLKAHVDEFGADQLYAMYSETLRAANYPVGRPGSFTKAMLIIKNRSSDNQRLTKARPRMEDDPQYQFFAENSNE